ncbi:MAG TPA: hypothetical protein VLH56_04250, partial [Dissulfurispiraceae bacterium]|nr:hypothetical protein [Dissulfurispiraceae bacterium]
GERLRSGAQATEEALSRPGRFKAVRDNLEVKEIVVGDGSRRRRFILAQVRQELKRIGDLEATEQGKGRGRGAA